MRWQGRLWLLWSALPGCFIISGEDLKLHDRKLGDNPPDTGGDADTDADSDTDTDADADAVDRPVVAGIDTSLQVDLITFDIELSDPNGDLTGGRIRFSLDGASLGDYALSDFGWDGTHALVTLPELFPCEGFSRTYSFVPVDEAGHEGLPYEASTSLQGMTISEGGEPLDIGALNFPALLCSDHDAGENQDRWTFQTSTTGAWLLQLYNPVGDERNLFLYDAVSLELQGATNAYSYITSFVALFSPKSYDLRITQDPDLPIASDYRIYITKFE